MSLGDDILNLRRYLPQSGKMNYWQGDTPDNRGIYVDLGAVMGNLKQAIKRTEKRLKLIGYVKEENYYNEVDKIFKEEFGDKLT